MATQRRGRKKEPRPWAVYARRRRLGLCIHCGWGEDTKFHREQCPGPPAALRPRLTLRPPVRTARGAAVAAGWVEKKSERRQGLIALKVRAGCKECRERHPACLEFHHRDSAQKAFTLSSPVALSKPWDVLLTEMAKCDVLCANCHRKRRWASRTRQSKRKLDRRTGDGTDG